MARAVVVCGLWVVVLRFRIGTTWNLKLVAHAISINIVRAVAVAVQELAGRVDAQVEVGHACSWIKVAGIFIHAAHTGRKFTRSSNQVICRWIEVARGRNCTTSRQTGAIVVGGVRIEVGGVGLGAAQHFELVAHAVSIRIVQAVAVAIVREVRQVAQAIVQRRFRIVVAGLRVGATCAACEVARTLDLVIRVRVVVARRGEGATAHKARPVIKCCVRIVVGVGWIGATLLVRVTDVVLVDVFRAVASTHPNGVQLVAIAIAVAFRNVLAAALVNGTRATANAAVVEFGT